MEWARRIIVFLILVSVMVFTKPFSLVHAQEPSCTITSITPRLPGKDSNISVTFTVPTATRLELFLSSEPLDLFQNWVQHIDGPITTTTVNLGKKEPGNYTVWLQRPTFSRDFGRNICARRFAVGEIEGREAVNEDKEARLANVCRSISEEITRKKCEDCFLAHNAWTALGCLNTQQPTSDTAESQGFISTLITLGAGLAGGIAFLLILFGGFQIITSAGNPERLNAGRELVTSAIAGLLLIVFSIFLLKIIGVDILGIPDFK